MYCRSITGLEVTNTDLTESGQVDLTEPDDSVLPEQQPWTLTDGTEFEAEFINVFGDKAAFKTAKKIQKVPLDQFSKASMTRIELLKPPELAFTFVNNKDQKLFPAGIRHQTQRPPEHRCHYGIKIKQTSMGIYKHPLQFELFVLGHERLGDKFILLDRLEGSFALTKKNKRQVEFRSEREVVLQNYAVQNDIRGEKYYGYLVVVTDRRGETVGVGSSNDWIFENLENLRLRQVNSFMDKTCTRTFPTRPKARSY